MQRELVRLMGILFLVCALAVAALHIAALLAGSFHVRVVVQPPRQP